MMSESIKAQYVLCLNGSRIINKRTALFIDGVQAKGQAIRVLAPPRGNWCFVQCEHAAKISHQGKLSFDIGAVRNSQLSSVMCFHWLMLPLAVAIGLIARVPVLYDEYDHFEMNQLEGTSFWLKRRFFSLLVQWIHRVCLPWVSLVTCIHMDRQTLKRHLERWQPSVMEIHNYPASAWRDSGRARSPAGRLCFVYIGGVHKVKGVAAAADAFHLLPESVRQNSELHIFGKGDPDLIQRLRSMSGVVVHNGVTPEEFRKFTANHVCCGLAILAGTPRYSLVGTNCRKFFEYLALGIPVIATRVGEFPQIVDGHRVGLLIDTDLNPLQIAGQMQRLAEDKALFSEFSRNASALMAEKEMTWEHEWSRIESTGIISPRRKAA